MSTHEVISDPLGPSNEANYRSFVNLDVPGGMADMGDVTVSISRALLARLGSPEHVQVVVTVEPSGPPPEPEEDAPEVLAEPEPDHRTYPLDNAGAGVFEDVTPGRRGNRGAGGTKVTDDSATIAQESTGT